METYEFMKILGEKMNKVQQYYIRWARSQGINYNVLAVLYVTYKNDGCPQKMICDEWCLPKQTVNTTCKRLVGEGLITLEKSDGDRRETRVRLTEKGFAFAERVVEKLLEIEGGVLEGMGASAAEKLLKDFVTYSGYMEEQFTGLGKLS